MSAFAQTILEFLKLCLVVIMLGMLFRVTQELYPKKYPKQMNTATHVHKHIYIDKSMNAFYAVEIKLAADRWTKATNHIAEFDVEMVDDHIRDQIRRDPDALVVTFITEDNPVIIRLDEENHESTLAYCDIKAYIPILAYVEGRVTDALFEKVTMHELGHALLLEHTEGPSGVGNIMYPTTELMGNGISQKDLEQFCSIYHCDPTKLKYEEESLHL